jgi:hypothetical protein
MLKAESWAPCNCLTATLFHIFRSASQNPGVSQYFCAKQDEGIPLSILTYTCLMFVIIGVIWSGKHRFETWIERLHPFCVRHLPFHRSLACLCHLPSATSFQEKHSYIVSKHNHARKLFPFYVCWKPHNVKRQPHIHKTRLFSLCFPFSSPHRVFSLYIFNWSLAPINHYQLIASQAKMSGYLRLLILFFVLAAEGTTVSSQGSTLSVYCSTTKTFQTRVSHILGLWHLKPSKMIW